MAQFSKLVITNKGQALIAKMIAGTGNIEFTKISASSHTYTEGQLQALTALADVKQTSLISKVTRTNNVAIKVETAFTNTELTAGYYMKALGLYARDPQEGEILYAATVETSGNCYMPPYNGITVSGAYVTLVTTVGNAENVSLRVDQAAVATIGDIEDLQQQISDLQAIIGYTDPDIFGVEVDLANRKFTRLAGALNRTGGKGFDDVHCFGGRRRCNVGDDGTVKAYYGGAGYKEDGTNGQVMVEQPKFYYKVVPLVTEIINEGQNQGHHIRKARYYVSPQPKAGFKLHPAFIENGNENDFIYLAAFEGSIYDNDTETYIKDDAVTADFAADKLSSIANVKPASGITNVLTRANTRKLANNRGKGWEQSYAATAAASQLLMLVEYASFNMQSNIGMGAVSKVDDGASSMTENTGGSASLGNASGAVNNSNNIQIVSYRGEENFWGNIWTWVDGMNEENPADWNTTNEEGKFTGQHGRLYVADHDFADNVKISPYVDTGICPVYGVGYVSAIGYDEEFDWLFIPTEATGTSALPISDYYWNQNPGWRVAVLGGIWNNGADAGAFYWDLSSASSHRYRGIGGRLVYVPSKKTAAA